MLSNTLTHLTIAATLFVSACSSALAGSTGPSSSQSPYLVRSQPGVVTASILTTGDAVNYKADGVTPYRMAGLPDGLGAFDNNDGTFTVLMNHELVSGAGIVRDHGFKGAYVSKWIIAKDNLTVRSGEDLIKTAYRWDIVTHSYQPLNGALSRFCSGDLPAFSAFYNVASGLGYNGRIYMNGEENGVAGHTFSTAIPMSFPRSASFRGRTPSPIQPPMTRL